MVVIREAGNVVLLLLKGVYDLLSSKGDFRGLEQGMHRLVQEAARRTRSTWRWSPSRPSPLAGRLPLPDPLRLTVPLIASAAAGSIIAGSVSYRSVR